MVVYGSFKNTLPMTLSLKYCQNKEKIHYIDPEDIILSSFLHVTIFLSFFLPMRANNK